MLEAFICFHQELSFAPKHFYLPVELTGGPNPSGDASYLLWQKLKDLRDLLKGWNTSVFGCLEKKSSDLKLEIDRIDLISESRSLSGFEKSLRSLSSALLIQNTKRLALLWSQKARIKWINEGDCFSKFFHLIANYRVSRNFISELICNGITISEPSCLKREAAAHFRLHFSKSYTPRWDLPDLPFKYLSRYQSQSLESVFSEEEILEALHYLNGAKAPGPDGFTISFFQNCWQAIRLDVLKIFDSFYSQRELGKGINSTFLALIPKSDSPSSFSDFRPIGLVTATYKLLAKVLSKRLKKVISSVVSDTQSGFIAGRQILDGILIASEIVHSAKKSNQHLTIIKLDFEKAYNSISWEYLLSVLSSMGFGEKWCSWMRICFKAHISVLLNGSPSSDFLMGRGIRQGCPLSPLLFAIAGEGLHLIMEKGIADGSFAGFKFGLEGPEIPHLQFVDDTIIFIDGGAEAISNLKLSLAGFQLCSELFGCSSCSLPFPYLGFSLGANPRRIKTWEPIIVKYKRKLNLWQARYLSLGGRVTLIKSTLVALPLYYMSLLKAPKGVILNLEKWQMGFLWSKSAGKKAIHKVCWDKVCSPKNEGGLGIMRLSLMNDCLLSKWWWRFFYETDSLWKQVLCIKYGWNVKDWNFCSFDRIDRSSWLGHIHNLSLEPKFSSLFGHTGVGWNLGDGDRIKFWQDIWVGDSKLKDKYQSLFAIAANKSGYVNEFWVNNDWYIAFNRLRQNWESNLEHKLLYDLASFSPNPSLCDHPIWLNNSQGYKVSSIYKFLAGQGPKKAWGSALWKAGFVPKITAFLWLCCHDAIPIKAFLEERGLRISINQSLCPFCSQAIEDAPHLLLHCHKTWSLWGKIFKWWRISFVMPGDIPSLLVSWNSLSPLVSKLFWKGIIGNVLWETWLARNDYFFNNKAVKWEALLWRIQLAALNVLKAKTGDRFNFSILEWSRSPVNCIRKFKALPS